MRRQAGYSFLELVVVIGLVGVIAAMTITTGGEPVSAQKLQNEAQNLAEDLAMLVSQARATQTSMKITCSSSAISVNAYRSTASKDATSNMIAGTVGLGVLNVTNGNPTKSITLASYDQRNSLVMVCPSALSYITSDGNLLTSSNANFDLIFSSVANPNLQSRLLISKVGFPRVFLKDTANKNQWTEVIR